MSTTTLIAPEPGIYPAVPFEEYAAWPYLNQSGAKRLLRSPAHFKSVADDESESKSRGTICHAGLWEADRFDEQYAIGPDVKLNTKEGKTEWAAFCDANPGKYHVRGADGAAMLGVRESIWKHKNARELLSATGPCEMSIVWDDADTGVRWKARIDKHIPDFAVVDLKTTTDARLRAFQKKTADYSYHLQAASNLFGMAAVGLTVESFYIIAAEVSAPNGVMVYLFSESAIVAGRKLMLDASLKYLECQQAGDWPAYDESALTLDVPAWA